MKPFNLTCKYTVIFVFSFLCKSLILCQDESGEQVVDEKAPPPLDYAVDLYLSNASKVSPDSEESGFGMGCGTNETDISFGRAAIHDRHKKWRFMNIYINYSDFEEDHVKLINKAAFLLHGYLRHCDSGIGIWPPGVQPKTRDYVFIYSGKDCSSLFGRQGGKQVLSLSTKFCMNFDYIVHELMHALGFHHEHQRYDRDEYINIYPRNIWTHRQSQFQKLPEEGFIYYNLPYNIRSVMHYDSYQSSWTGKPTILLKDGTEIPPNSFTDDDREMLLKHYCT